MSELLTVKQMADRLKLNVITVYKYIKSGQIKAKKVGNRIRIEECEMQKLITNMQKENE